MAHRRPVPPVFAHRAPREPPCSAARRASGGRVAAPSTAGAGVSEAEPPDYDTLAWFYERYWSGGLSPALWKAAEGLLAPALRPGARVLDLCCGTGVSAAGLTARGCAVVAVDASQAMAAYARRRAPAADVRVADARTFALDPQEPRCDAALCLGDGINHQLSADDVAYVFRRARAALRPGAAFVFDVVAERRFLEAWNGHAYAVQHDDHGFEVAGRYDPATRIGRTELAMTWATPGGVRRAAVTLHQRCHPLGEVRAALRAAGFDAARWVSANAAGLTHEDGRLFVVARAGA